MAAACILPPNGAAQDSISSIRGRASRPMQRRRSGRMHLAAEWGGTGFNFEHSRARFETYAASAQRFGAIVAQAGADAHIANHTNQDNSPAKMAALEKRKAGDPHPYVVGTEDRKSVV